MLATKIASAPVSSKRSRIALGVSVLILVAVIVVVSTIVFDNSGDGVASLVGYAIGSVLGSSVLLLLLRKKIVVIQRLAIACLMASGLILFDKRDDISSALEAREAQKIIAENKGTDPETLYAKYPQNKMIRSIADVSAAAKVTKNKIAALIERIEPPALANAVAPSAPRPSLIKYRDAARMAASNARAAVAQIDTLYEDEASRIRQRLSDYESRSYINSIMNGVYARHRREIPLMKNFIESSEGLYESVSNFSGHLVDNYGQYQVSSRGQILYPANDAAALARHKTLLAAQQAAISKFQLAQKQIEQAQSRN